MIGNTHFMYALEYPFPGCKEKSKEQDDQQNSADDDQTAPVGAGKIAAVEIRAVNGKDN